MEDLQKHKDILRNVDQVRRMEHVRRMKRVHLWKRILLIFSISGLTLVAATLIGASFFLGSALKGAVESFGPKFTQSEVRLGDAGISLLRGSAYLTDLVIGNPQGFRTKSALRIGEVRINLNSMSLFEDLAHILEIEIVAPQLTYEIGVGGTNIDTLRKNIARSVGTAPAAATAPASGAGVQGDASPGQVARKDDGRKFVVNHLYVRNARVEIAAPIGDTASVTIPDIHLKDLGRGLGGMNAAEIVVAVILPLSESVATATAGLVLDREGVIESIQKEVEKGT